MTKIKKLTKVQTKKLSAYRDKWLSVGLSTSPTDRKQAEKSIDDVYAAADQPKPQFKIWIQSPYRGAIAATILSQVRAQVWDQVWAQVRDQVWAQVRDQVGDQVRDRVWDQVWAQVGDQVWAQVWDPVRDRVGDQVRARVRDQVYKCGYGLQDANWLGFYDFFSEVLGLECCAKLAPMMNLAKFCGWWWPFENAVILTEKPTSIHRDERNRLHNLNGLALAYSDGWGVYAINGVLVPEKYILAPAHQIDPKEVLSESNAEVRMAVIEKCGNFISLESLGLK